MLLVYRHLTGDIWNISNSRSWFQKFPRGYSWWSWFFNNVTCNCTWNQFSQRVFWETSRPSQTSKMENFATLINDFYPLKIVAKFSILDISEDLGYDSGFPGIFRGLQYCTFSMKRLLTKYFAKFHYVLLGICLWALYLFVKKKVSSSILTG